MVRPQILSVHERLDVDPDVTGKGVCLAFVDLGFYAHPDLVQPRRRIRAYVDVTRDRPVARELYTPRGSSWHGTMTACSAAGNGYLSGGRYRGLASQADVVLIKCGAGEAPSVEGNLVARALRVPLTHPELGIRVLNISLGVEHTDPAVDDVMAAVEELARAGVVVFSAAGNDPSSVVGAPASSPHVVAVGGVNDGNTRDPAHHRTTGFSHQGGPPQKPELLAPAELLAAPMLPGTLVAREAGALFDLLGVLEEELADQEFALQCGVDLSDATRGSLRSIWEAVETRLRDRKYISPDYQHVDGTSFASPLVASVAAQMLEVNPSLTPAQVRAGLLATAQPLARVPLGMQGAGVVHPRNAVAWARKPRATPRRKAR